ncbi:MAG: L-threonylcarbamoyladenylate synthase [Bacteroidia bacterium]|nr:L-threonylcarbamoyladenylate synthase [Bacteroidia bacterium]
MSKDVEMAATFLERGEVIAIPTETVYGLAANGLSLEAVKKIFLLKNRPFSDPLILHVGGMEAVEALGISLPLWARQLIHRFWPGPLTLLLPKSSLIPEIVTAGLPRVAVRAPNHPLTQALLQRLPFPLAAPSANPFGAISPTTAEHVYRYFAGKIPFILEGGECEAGIESTIIGEENGRLLIYRPGVVSKEEIEKVIGERVFTKSFSPKPEVPGQFPRHYAPRKPLLYGWQSPPLEPHASVVLFRPPSSLPSHRYVHFLSYEDNVEEAASRLYATLHNCEQEPTEFILVQTIPLDGIGEALNDRLRRAATPSLFTIGHSNHRWEDFMDLLRRYEIAAIIDIRKHPYSPKFPHFSQSFLQKDLYENGIMYEWQPNLSNLVQKIERISKGYERIALLCAEGEPNRCHRFRLSDELTQAGYTIFHILPEKRLQLHRAPISLGLEERI